MSPFFERLLSGCFGAFRLADVPFEQHATGVYVLFFNVLLQKDEVFQ